MSGYTETMLREMHKELCRIRTALWWIQMAVYLGAGMLVGKLLGAIIL